MGNQLRLFIRSALLCALIASVAPLPGRAAIIVQLRVVDGEGAVHAAGSRATRGITVQVTDETGKPVEGAAVSFRLPDQGPGGSFNGGLKSEVVTTRPDGKATIWGMQWNKTPGPFDVRITAVKDQARAGIVSQQYLSDTPQVKSGGNGVFQASHRGRSRWLAIAGIAAGAGVGLVLAVSHSSKASVSPIIPTQIGNPSIIVSGPPK